MVALLARTVAETGWGPDLLSRHFAPAPDRQAPIEVPPIDAPPIGAPPVDAPRALPMVGITPDWGLLLRRHFWAGDRFRDRLGSDATSGEANIWPFFAGLIDDRPMLAAALETLGREGFATPYPLKFEAGARTEGELLVFRVWSPDYQTTTSWTSLGSIYLSLLREVDPAGAGVELERMRRLIERDGTFWEVLDARGQPWRSASRVSISDTSMLWGAILLATLEQPGGPPLRLG
jgi:hypothetical protein